MKVDIISGFLGAGKTSFINRYLPLLKGKLALIENEFGDVSVDSDLIEQDIPMKEIFAGCICCTLRGDFASGIKDISEAYGPDRVVVEPSGVGRLSDVVKGIEDAGKLSGVDLQIDRLIVLVDADTFEDYSEHFGPFYLDQIQHANLIFLSFLEGMDQEDLKKIGQKIRSINPKATIFTADYRDLDDPELIKIISQAQDTIILDEESTRSIPGDKVFSSFSINSQGLTGADLELILEKLGNRDYGYVLRAKGFIKEGGGQVVQYTPSKLSIEKAKKDMEEKIVLIGSGLNKEEIIKIFDQAKGEDEMTENFKDKMTPMERLGAFMTGAEMDRMLIMPIIVSVAHRASTMTHREKRQSADLMAKALLDSYARWNHDILIVEYGLHGVGDALGTEMNDPDDSVPATVNHVLQDFDYLGAIDFSKALKENDDWLRKTLEAVRILVKEKGDEVPIAVLISGPFTAATSIYPMDKILRSMRKDPDKVHELLKKTTDILKPIYEDFIEAGAIIVQCDPIASGTILHVNQYREFVKPYATEISETIHQAGGTNVYHICGDSSTITVDMVETGCDMLSVDNIVDLEDVKRAVGDRVPILGNVDPVGVLLHGPKEAIFESVKECIAKAYDSPKGYILASGCDITQNVPLEHIDWFMEAGRKYGAYPLDMDQLK